jgi:hypothetical protein
VELVARGDLLLGAVLADLGPHNLEGGRRVNLALAALGADKSNASGRVLLLVAVVPFLVVLVPSPTKVHHVAVDRETLPSIPYSLSVSFSTVGRRTELRYSCAASAESAYFSACCLSQSMSAVRRSSFIMRVSRCHLPVLAAV